MVFGVLVGYALAQLHYRGRGTLFAAMVLLQVVPFQLLIIPLYVQIVRSYGLADSYLGMILPFAINSTAVFVFRQYFLQVPAELFDAARIDGASELRILRSVALPLVRPALLTAILMTFIGPWNEFLWPFLVTKQHDKQPLAVALANYISTTAASATNPYGAILAGACVLAGAGGRAVHRVPATLRVNRPGLRGEGLMTTADVRQDVPYRLTRLGVVMRPDPAVPFEAEGVLNPAQRPHRGRPALAAAPAGRAGNVSRIGLAEVIVDGGVPVGVRRDSVVLSPDAGWERGARPRRRRGSAHDLDPDARAARDDLCRLRSARPEAGAGRLRRPADLAPARPGALRLSAGPRHRPEPLSEQGRRVLPGAGDRARTAVRPMRCCIARCGTSA